MGRPKLKKTERRGSRVSFYTTAEMRVNIERAAVAHGHRTAGDWLCNYAERMATALVKATS